MMNRSEIKSPLDVLRNLIGGYLQDEVEGRDGVGVAIIDRKGLVETVKYIRDVPELRLRYLSYITAVDRIESEKKLYAIYEFVNIDDDRRLRIHVPIPEKDPWVPSISQVYPSANWHEREMMEMFGIEVRDHPDPRKLLLPDWVDSNPLRKSFPHDGHALWKFHQDVIEMFNEKNEEYRGGTDDSWLERFLD